METVSLTTVGADSNRIQLNSVPVELQAGSDVTIGIGPEHLERTDTDNADIFATVALPSNQAVKLSCTALPMVSIN